MLGWLSLIFLSMNQWDARSICSDQCRATLSWKWPSQCCEKRSCLVCEPTGASARKPTVPLGQSVKSDSHLYAELPAKSARVGLCLCCRQSQTGSSRHHFPRSLFAQATPDVDEEGFSLRPGDEADDILLMRHHDVFLSKLSRFGWLDDTLDQFTSIWTGKIV